MRDYVRKKAHVVAGHELKPLLASVRASQMTAEVAAEHANLCPRTVKKWAAQNDVDLPRYIVQGRSTVFSDSQEKEIVEWIELRARRFDAVTINDLAIMAFNLAEANRIAHPFKNGKAGTAWVNGFLSRRDLRRKLADYISINRAEAFTRDSVEIFFGNLLSVVNTYNIGPSHIFNVDESGFSVVRKYKEKVVAPRSMKKVLRKKPAERGTNVTAIIAVSATGEYLPPTYVFKAKRIQEKKLLNAPEDALFLASPKGWANAEIFAQWMSFFDENVKRNDDSHVLVVLDGHTSHKDLGARLFSQGRNIHLVTLPPHSSHATQPLDVCIFGPLKKRYEVELSKFPPGRLPTVWDIPGILKEPMRQTFTKENAVSGFRATGIWVPEEGRPNSLVYKDDQFMDVIAE